MTLKEKYTIKNKNRIKSFIFFYSILVIFFVIDLSFAKYEMKSEGDSKVAVANWKITLNGEELTSNNNTLTNIVTLTPTTDIDEADSTKIKPGQSGYFDIEIDPTDTEVSFFYQIELDLINSVIPNNFSINSYSINNGTVKDLPNNNSVSNTVFLGNKNIFTANDKQIIRFFWSWTKGDYEEKKYTISSNIEIKQVL